MGGRGGNIGGGMNDYDGPYNTYGLSASFLEGLGIVGPLHNKVFVANVSILFFINDHFNYISYKSEYSIEICFNLIFRILMKLFKRGVQSKKTKLVLKMHVHIHND